MRAALDFILEPQALRSTQTSSLKS